MANFLIPEIVFACGVVVMLLIALFWNVSLKKPFALFLLVAIVTLVYFGMDKPIWLISDYDQYQLFHLFPSSKAFFSQNSYIVLFKIILLLTSLIIVLVMPRSWFESFREIPILLSIGILGMLLAISAHDLMALYLSLEMQALAFCLLIPIGTHFSYSKEAAIKYFAMSAVASGLLLYGISLVYIATQSTAIPTEIPSQNLGQIGFLIVVVAILAKIGIAPFHFWLPDVYQGSPNYITTFMATAVKVMGIVLLFRILSPHIENEVVWMLVVSLAIISMIWASLMALRQSDFKRLIGYSSINHMGYILAIFLTDMQWQLMLVYTFAYLVATLGAMLVLISINSEREKEEQGIDVFAGLSQQSPFLAFQMTVFLLSLVGIPFTAGFWSKFWVFAAVMEKITPSTIFLLTAAGATTVISLFYYLKIVGKMYFDDWQSHYRVVQSRPRMMVALIMFALVIGFVVAQVQIYGMLFLS